MVWKAPKGIPIEFLARVSRLTPGMGWFNLPWGTLILVAAYPRSLA